MSTTALLTLALLASSATPAEPPAGPARTPAAYPVVAERVKQLAAFERFEARHIGYAGERSKAHMAFEAVLEVAEDADLEGLLRHESPVVRLYAAWGLNKRGYSADRVLPQLAGPDELVESQAGCMRMRSPVGITAKHIFERNF